MKTWHVMAAVAAVLLAILAYALVGDLLSGKSPFQPEPPKVVVPDLPQKNEGINPIRPIPDNTLVPAKPEAPKPPVTIEAPGSKGD
jgi:hypothetical protein